MIGPPTQPDICYFGPPKAATIQPEMLYYPAPDLIVEVLSKSTQKNDREVKFEDYAVHNVSEYWIIDPTSRRWRYSTSMPTRKRMRCLVSIAWGNW